MQSFPITYSYDSTTEPSDLFDQFTFLQILSLCYLCLNSGNHFNGSLRETGGRTGTVKF